MAVFIKRKKFLALEVNRSESHYLFDSLSQELKRISLELRNIEYHFFEANDELLKQKKDFLVLRNWLKNEIEEISQVILKYN